MNEQAREKERVRELLRRAVREGKVIQSAACSSCGAEGRVEAQP